jgi:hypothetical protein
MIYEEHYSVKDGKGCQGRCHPLHQLLHALSCRHHKPQPQIKQYHRNYADEQQYHLDVFIHCISIS